MKGLVSKPQFDLEIFKKGLAVEVTTGAKDWRSKKVRNGVIIGGGPLKITVNVYREEDDERVFMENIVIDVDDVVEEKTVVKFLEPSEKREKLEKTVADTLVYLDRHKEAITALVAIAGKGLYKLNKEVYDFLAENEFTVKVEGDINNE